jgi:hypothetical protein
LKLECVVALTSGREGKEVAGRGVAVVIIWSLMPEVVLELRLDVTSSDVVVDIGGFIDTTATGGDMEEIAVPEGVGETEDWPQGG